VQTVVENINPASKWTKKIQYNTMARTHKSREQKWTRIKTKDCTLNL